MRSKDNISFDIHDRVNYSVEKSDLVIDTENSTITLNLTIDTSICSVISYFEIFMGRMLLCRRAADFFDMKFSLNINGQQLM